MSANSLPPITEDDIAEYLTNTPGFFERHLDVLSTVQLTSPHSHRAISLQERQAEILRGKVRDLELKAAQMIRYGQSNVTIADKLQDWTCELLTARDATTLVDVATQGLARIYELPQHALRIWGCPQSTRVAGLLSRLKMRSKPMRICSPSPTAACAEICRF